MKTKVESFKKFYWQDGYVAFSINPSEMGKVIKYIDNQHEHYRKIPLADLSPLQGLFKNYIVSQGFTLC